MVTKRGVYHLRKGTDATVASTGTLSRLINRYNLYDSLYHTGSSYIRWYTIWTSPSISWDRTGQADRRKGSVAPRLGGTRLSQIRQIVPSGRVLMTFDDKHADRCKIKGYPKMDICFLLLQMNESERLFA